MTGVVLTEGKAAARMRFEVRLSDEDEELATEKIHEGRGANQHELGEDTGKSEPPDEEWSSQEADQEAEPGNGSEEGELGGSGLASGDEDETGVEEVGDLIGEGKGDQVVDDEISLSLCVGDRLALFAGLDDMVVEAVRQGAVGWVAGLVNALPYESVLLFDKAVCGLEDPAVAREADRIYKWFLPLLRLDCVPEFVQLIKLVQQEVARGSERVRPPRFPAVGHLRTGALEVIRETLASNPIQDVEENR